MDISPPLTHHKAPDGGWGWVVVFGSFMIDLIAAGFFYTSGIFYEKFLDIYGKSETITSLYSSIMTAMIYCIAPFASGLIHAYGCRRIAIIGSLMAVTGMLGSVVFDSIYFHCITLGLITGSGLGLLYLPQVMIVTYWFDKRLSFATGIAVCGSGIGIAIFAVISESLIHEFGWKGAMIFLAAIMFTCVAYSSLFRKVDYIKEDSDLKSALKETFNFSILKDFVFLYFTFANFLNATVLYVPIIFLKDHAQRTGIGNDTDAITLMVFFGLADCMGRAVFGYIADIESLNRIILYALSVVIYGVAIGFIAAFGHNYHLLVVSIIIFGAAEGAFVCLSSVVMVDLFGLNRVSNAFGIISFIEGIAALIGPPIIGKTVNKTTGYTTGFYISSVLIIFSGVMLLFLPILNRKLKEMSEPINNNQIK